MQEAKFNLGKVVRVARKRKRITQDYKALILKAELHPVSGANA